MAKIKEPSIESLQKQLDELYEKSNNTYTDQVLDTFVNGWVMDLVSSNISTIEPKQLQTWLSNPDRYINEINSLLAYYYIVNPDIFNAYTMMYTLPTLDYKIKCYEKKKTYDSDIIKLKKTFDKIGYKRMIRDLIIQQAHEGTVISTWMGNASNPYLYVFEDLKYVYPYGKAQGKMVAVVDLQMLKDMKKEVERQAMYENLKPLVTQKRYESWLNENDKVKKEELRYVILPSDKTYIGRSNVLYSNQRLGIPMGTPALFDLTHKQKLKDLERSISERIIRTFALLKFKGIDDSGNKVSDTAKSKVFTSVKNALEKSVKVTATNGNSVSVIGIPDFADFEFSSFAGVDDALDPKKYESIDDDITNGTGISRALTNGNGASFATGKLALQSLYRRMGVILEDMETVMNQLIYIVLGKKAENYYFEFDKSEPATRADRIKSLQTLVAQGYSVKALTDELGIDFDDYITQSIYEIEVLKLRDKILPQQSTYTMTDNKGAGREKVDPNNPNTEVTQGNDANSSPEAKI